VIALAAEEVERIISAETQRPPSGAVYPDPTTLIATESIQRVSRAIGEG
jgi:hypothetical protein